MTKMEELFLVSPAVRYVAISHNGSVTSHERDDLVGPSSSESDKYEELIVNPTLLSLAKRRGDIDCGGASYIVIGYGNFRQLVLALPHGHASIGFESSANPLDHLPRIMEILS